MMQSGKVHDVAASGVIQSARLRRAAWPESRQSSTLTTPFVGRRPAQGRALSPGQARGPCATPLPRQRSRRRRGAHDRFGRDGDLRPASAPATTQTPAGALAADCSAHEALTRHLWWRRAQDRRCSTGRAGSEGDRAAGGSGGPIRPSRSARCPEADVLGQGALTSPGHFTNTAQPIARLTARNRASPLDRGHAGGRRERYSLTPVAVTKPSRLLLDQPGSVGVSAEDAQPRPQP